MTERKRLHPLIFIIIIFILPVFILSPNVFSLNQMPTNGGDIRAHLGKITFLTEKTRASEFPLWDAYWYAGYPYYSSYPQLTYYLALPVSLLTTPTLAFNIIRYFSILTLAVAVYAILNSILADSKKAFPLTLFFIFNPLTFFMIDTAVIPNILGWAFALLFIAYFMSTGGQGKTIIFGSLALLAHPYTIVFSGMALVVFLVVKRFERSYTKKFLISFAFIIAISSFWFIPALSNIPYMSSFFENFLNSDIIIIIASLPLLLFLTARTLRKRNDLSLWALSMTWLCLTLPILLLFPSMFLGIRIFRLCFPFFFTLLIALNIRDSRIYEKLFIVFMALLIVFSGIGMMLIGIHMWDYTVHEPDPVLNRIERQYRIIGLEFPTMEADTFITFAAENKAMSFTGPFNQGDPKFDLITYIPEREWWRMTGNPILAKNIMQETFSKYIYSNNLIKGFNATPVLENHPINKRTYYLMELEEPVNYALSVSPIVLYSDIGMVEELDTKSNIGYKFVFVDREYENLYDFRILMTDEMSRLSDIEMEGKIILLYHSDGSIEHENKNYSLDDLESLFIDLDLKYSPVEWKRPSTEEIKISVNDQRFILVKESWHPGWESRDAEVLRDKHGFMVIIPEKSEVTLRFQERYLAHGIIVSIIGLALFVIFRKRIYAL